MGTGIDEHGNIIHIEDDPDLTGELTREIMEEWDAMSPEKRSEIEARTFEIKKNVWENLKDKFEKARGERGSNVCSEYETAPEDEILIAVMGLPNEKQANMIRDHVTGGNIFEPI